MRYQFNALLRFAKTFKGSITFGIIGFLLVVGLATGKATAQKPSAGGIHPSAAAQIQALVQEKQSRTPAQRKISSHILHTIRTRRGDAVMKRIAHLKPFVQLTPDNKVRLNIKTNVEVTTDLIDKIRANGAEVLSAFPDSNAIQVSISIDQVESLADLSEIRAIKPYIAPRLLRDSAQSLDPSAAAPASAVVRRVITEGDVAHNASLVRSKYGINGTGLKIGVLSDSYNNLGRAAADIAVGNLPANGVTLVGSGDLTSGGTDEGRAMLQIVHTLAPGAELYFATSNNSEADFANNILALRLAGCDIIVDDTSYSDEPVFQDGAIAQAVNTVTAGGALYFSAAGNEGNKDSGTSGVWEGNFVDGGAAPLGLATRVHQFGGSTLNRLTTDSGNYITLQWSDAFGQSGNDYDLYVLDPSGTQVVDSSTNSQTGTQDPFEIVNFEAANNQVIVVLYNGAPRYLQLNTNGGQLAINTQGQTSGHSAAVNAFSVAAVDAQGRTTPFVGGVTNPVESFSSDGPRRIFYNPDGTPVTPGDFLADGGVVRQKPDIAAADGVKTSLPAAEGLNPFFGTSAAAPHAAAVAALLKSYKPTLTPAQIRTILTTTALKAGAPKIGATGPDPDSGYGIVMADRALLAAQQY